MKVQRSISQLLTRLAVFLLLAVIFWTGSRYFGDGNRSDEAFANHLKQNDIEQVELVSLGSSVNAPGEIQSANNTIIECEIDRLSVSARGGYVVSGSSTRILKIIPDGSIVKKGDVLCQLDSRDFEEMARLQRINLEQALLMTRYTEMDLQVSEIVLQEYKYGTVKRTLESLRMQIQLTQSEAERASRRLQWSQKMAEKGYVTDNAVRADEFQVYKSDVLLSRAKMALDTYEKFSLPKSEHSLNARIQSQKWVLTYYQQWVETQRKRLELFEDQIRKCTVVAPHDGMVIYANEDDGDTRIEIGAEVRRKQDLFYLPDLNNMQVLAKLSQSIVNRVKVGMPVTIRLETLEGTSCEGIVTKVAQMPIPATSRSSSNEVKNYFCVVSIHGQQANLRPGINAEIEIHTDEDHQTLVVSPEVVQIEADKEYCLVLRNDGKIEKREIRVRSGDHSYVVVEQGLKQGESVIRRPRYFEDEFGSVTNLVALTPSRQITEEKTPVLALGNTGQSSESPADHSQEQTHEHANTLQPVETVLIEPGSKLTPAR
jgi:HlyD family secretion protein